LRSIAGGDRRVVAAASHFFLQDPQHLLGAAAAFPADGKHGIRDVQDS
jgi:hypothetical protein